MYITLLGGGLYSEVVLFVRLLGRIILLYWYFKHENRQQLKIYLAHI